MTVLRLPGAAALVLLVLMTPCTTPATAEPDLRLVVFETGACPSCRLLREAVLRDYPLSPLGRTVPMTVVDVETLGTGGFALGAALRILPTTVLLRSGREVARVVGYPGRARFFRLIRTAMTRCPTGQGD